MTNVIETLFCCGDALGRRACGPMHAHGACKLWLEGYATSMRAHGARMAFQTSLIRSLPITCGPPYARIDANITKNYKRKKLVLEKASLAAIQLHAQSLPNLIGRRLFWAKIEEEESKSQGITFEASTERKSKYASHFEVSLWAAPR